MRLVTLLSLVLSTISTAAAQDRPAAIVAATPTPGYPAVLKAAGIGGTASAWVVILPGDSVALDGVHVASIPHPGFRNAVVDGLRRWRYQGTLRRGVPVVDSIRVEMAYTPAAPSRAEFDSLAVGEIRRDRRGVWSLSVQAVAITGPWVAPNDSMWRVMGVRAMGKVLEWMENREDGTVPIVCVGFERARKAFPVTAAELRALHRPGIAVVVQERCPPTIASMAWVQGQVIPPGEEPIELHATEVKAVGGRWYTMTVEMRWGTTGSRYQCAMDVADTTRPIRCRAGASWVS